MKYYAVAKGRKIGVYSTWEACQNQVEHYRGSVHKAFDNYDDATKYIITYTGDVTTNYDRLSYVPKAWTIYTDGSCDNNGKPNVRAGYGVYWGDNHPNNVAERLVGSKVTSIRAEYMAVITAIRQARNEGFDKVIIRTDLQLIVKSIKDYSKNWLRNGYHTAMGEDVSNQDLIKEIFDHYEVININFEKVKGHSTDVGNKQADKLAALGKAK